MSRLDFEAGLASVQVSSAHSTTIHRLACSHLTEATGETSATGYWIDARNAASTHALYECAPSERSLAGLRVARAFTAYQHHSLVRRVARAADPSTAVVVAPNVAALYGDDDLAGWEREELLASTLATLRELGRALECPVLASAVGNEAAATVAEYADHELECVRTREGIRIEGDGASTQGYWHGAVWQTTIPYWVDVCGVADSIDPAVAAHDQGLLEGEPADAAREVRA